MTYHSLTPRQQRVWDAAYGAAFAAEYRVLHSTNMLQEYRHLTQTGRLGLAAEYAAITAHYAANSIQPNDDGQTTTD